MSYSQSQQLLTASSVGSSSKISQLRHRLAVLERLRELGLNRWDFRKSEVKYLPNLIHHDEVIGGALVGKDHAGYSLIAATDRRIIYLDKKPLYINSEDINYDAVGGLSFNWVGYFGTLTLHTRLGDFKFKIRNLAAATKFRSYVEQRCIEHSG